MLAQLADLRFCALMASPYVSAPLCPCALMSLRPYVPVPLRLRPYVLRPFVCALMSGFEPSKPFHEGAELRQGCVSSPLFFNVYMN